jgi:hypothetical protein
LRPAIHPGAFWSYMDRYPAIRRRFSAEAQRRFLTRRKRAEPSSAPRGG